MPRVLDTIAGFEAFARKAAMQTPFLREGLWVDNYEAAYPEVFEAFYETHGDPAGRAAVVRELGKVRERVGEAGGVVRKAIADVEKALPKLLDRPADPSPQHVIMVGTLTTNAAVGRLNDDVAVFHCLEWFQTPEGSRVLVAHETTHAWHELALGSTPPAVDAAWMAFYEGVAIAASRALVPDRPELEYFWYGHPDVEAWLPFCQENRQQLMDHFAASIDAPTTVETYFGGGVIQNQWRVGFYLADELVKSLNCSLADLVAMNVIEARSAIREALGVEPLDSRPGPH
ncbi:MAG: hypothetical protein ACRD2W_15630 [Acidimicrobiales bacterium]